MENKLNPIQLFFKNESDSFKTASIFDVGSELEITSTLSEVDYQKIKNDFVNNPDRLNVSLLRLHRSSSPSLKGKGIADLSKDEIEAIADFKKTVIDICNKKGDNFRFAVSDYLSDTQYQKDIIDIACNGIEPVRPESICYLDNSSIIRVSVPPKTSYTITIYGVRS